MDEAKENIQKIKNDDLSIGTNKTFQKIHLL